VSESKMSVFADGHDLFSSGLRDDPTKPLVFGSSSSKTGSLALEKKSQILSLVSDNASDMVSPVKGENSSIISSIAPDGISPSKVQEAMGILGNASKDSYSEPARSQDKKTAADPSFSKTKLTIAINPLALLPGSKPPSKRSTHSSKDLPSESSYADSKTSSLSDSEKTSKTDLTHLLMDRPVIARGSRRKPAKVTLVHVVKSFLSNLPRSQIRQHH